MEEKDKLRSKRFVEVIEELQISNQELKDKFKIDKTLKSKIVNGIQNASIDKIAAPSETRPNYIFQTFLYAAIMSRQQSLMVAPALLYIHRAASENYSPVIEMGEPRKPKIPVNNFAFFEDEFRERLQTLLEEIFSEEEPFTQTEDTKKCSYCDFKAICKR